jgi:proteasome lid subunit RPN8/RPN11
VSSDPPLQWQSDCGRYTVHLDAPLLRKISKIAYEHLPNEVGSSLSGFYTEDGFDAFVVDTAPVPPDSSGDRTAFKRGVKGLKDFFSSLTGNRESQQQHYVGEWHSHPTGGAQPSSTDMKSGMDIAHDEDVPCKEVVSLILGNVGASTPDLSMTVYSASDGAITLSRMHDTGQA